VTAHGSGQDLVREVRKAVAETGRRGQVGLQLDCKKTALNARIRAAGGLSPRADAANSALVSLSYLVTIFEGSQKSQQMKSFEGSQPHNK
jgi:hypothetical protein